MFENVTYTYYSDTLGRAIVPDEKSFNELKLTNIQEMKLVLDFVSEREENGIDSAVCMMIEAEYRSTHSQTTDQKVIASESVSGHSVSFDTSAINKANEKNVKSLAEQKLQAIKLFCDVSVGVA